MPQTYVVRPLDTLYTIAWRHNLDYRELAKWNHIGADYKLTIGQVLTLHPGGARVAASPNRAPGPPVSAAANGMVAPRPPANASNGASAPRPPANASNGASAPRSPASGSSGAAALRAPANASSNASGSRAPASGSSGAAALRAPANASSNASGSRAPAALPLVSEPMPLGDTAPMVTAGTQSPATPGPTTANSATAANGSTTAVAIREPAVANPPAATPDRTSAVAGPETPVAATPSPIDPQPNDSAASHAVSAVAGLKWMWPTDRLSAPRPVPGGGILLLGKLGQDVRAAGSGRVVYTGSGLRGYGNLIIIKHGDSLLSSYAHNREMLVHEGQEVAMGQVIARMGTGPHRVCALYFEIRVNGKPADPLRFLASDR